ncbi:ABC transporter permease [Paracoccus sp. Ld10]|uniref:ABC transporter permease n=1 Tax=Paracoccus sp. Ld10 TaxID=649158 RepID=UPI0038630C59
MARPLYPVITLRLLSGTVIATTVVLPVMLGLVHSIAAGFGHMPLLGVHGPDLDAWRVLLAQPGLWRAAALSLWTGMAATVIALVLSLGAVAALQGRGGALRRVMAPLLAAPHAAVAIGLAFVIAPSGWIARGLAPLLGWSLPPDLATVGDPWGLALTLGLVIKEVPFLTVVLLAALTQIPLRQQMAAGRALGYGRAAVWLWLLTPQLWPLIRLPVMVVLAFSVSVVDMALILGPSNPPTLAVMVARLFTDPDLRALLPASAGALLQLGLAGLAIAMLWGGAHLCGALSRRALRRGARGRRLDAVLTVPVVALMGLGVLALLSLAALGVWSVALSWRWPDAWPDRLTLRTWQDGGDWPGAAWRTLWIALAATGLAMALAIGWLEGGDRAGRPGLRGWMRAAVALPLVLPQLSVLIGLSGLLLRTDITPTIAVVWGHLLFVLPSVMIALAGPWAALDPRLDRAAAALGAGPWRRLVRVKLSVLLAPLSLAAALGFAVSVAQYLPTLFLGGGRIATLTTEAVALSSGSDRRVAAVHASLQAGLPWLVYLAALLLPALVHRNRRDLRGDGA